MLNTSHESTTTTTTPPRTTSLFLPISFFPCLCSGIVKENWHILTAVEDSLKAIQKTVHFYKVTCVYLKLIYNKSIWDRSPMVCNTIFHLESSSKYLIICLLTHSGCHMATCWPFIPTSFLDRMVFCRICNFKTWLPNSVVVCRKAGFCEIVGYLSIT